MADTVTVKKLFDSVDRTEYEFTNISDGTGESAVQKIDISSLVNSVTNEPVTSLAIIDADWEVNGFNYVQVLWDHTSDVQALLAIHSGFVDYSEIGYSQDTGSGGTGDILITTSGGAANSTYRIRIAFRKKYA